MNTRELATSIVEAVHHAQHTQAYDPVTVVIMLLDRYTTPRASPTQLVISKELLPLPSAYEGSLSPNDGPG